MGGDQCYESNLHRHPSETNNFIDHAVVYDYRDRQVWPWPCRFHIGLFPSRTNYELPIKKIKGNKILLGSCIKLVPHNWSNKRNSASILTIHGCLTGWFQLVVHINDSLCSLEVQITACLKLWFLLPRDNSGDY